MMLLLNARHISPEIKLARKATETRKKTGRIQKPLRFKSMCLKQGKSVLYAFSAKASVLFDALSINRRTEDKDEGYQRTLSISRVHSIAQHIISGKSIPGSIVVCFDTAIFKKETSELVVPKGTDVGWVIDGQHRLAGAHEASVEGTDIDLIVSAFVGMTDTQQVQEFITINREAKGVPTSLYLDLLGKLASKKPSDAAKERAADIANELRRDETSPFFERIVVVTSPKSGQVSMTNFARKLSPLLLPDKTLSFYSMMEQRAVISNYYSALRIVFPQEYKRSDSVFFRTVGFGGLWNAFPQFFATCVSKQGGFTVKDAIVIFRSIESFDFSAWRELGTGNQAEILAGDDLRTAITIKYSDENQAGGTLRV